MGWDVCCYRHDGRGGNGIMKTTYYPAIASKRTLKPFATRLRENIDPQTPILFYNSFDYGTIFYSRRDIAQYAQKVNELERRFFCSCGRGTGKGYGRKVL